MSINGVVLLNKPQGWTSRKAVNVVRRVFEKTKAGHTGTLDPLATGMLPIMLGKATRFASLGLDADKTYRVTIDFSLQTDTLDLEGNTTASFLHHPTETNVRNALDCFIGEQDQVPPHFSAIRIDGKRAHALARAGESFKMKARRITIHDIEFISYHPPLLSIKVRCSKGTYIRSLAQDIGHKLNVGGCVAALHRCSTAGWPERLMIEIEQLEDLKEQCILPMSSWLRDFPPLSLAQDLAQRFLHGQRLAMPNITPQTYQIMYEHHLLGTAQWREGVLHPQHVLVTPQEVLNV